MDTPLQLVVDQDGNAEAAAFCDSFLQLPVDDTSTDVAALCDSLLQACPPPPVPPPPSLQQHISSHLQQQEQEQQEQQQQQYQIKQEPQQQQLPQALYQQQQQRQQQQHQQQDQQLTPTTQQQNQPQQQTGYQMSQLQYLQQQLYHQQQQRNLLQQHYQQQQQLQQFQQQQHQLQQYQRQQQFLQQYSMYQNSQAPLAQHHHHHQQHHHQQQQHQQAPCMPALSSSLSSTSSTLTSSSLSPSRSSENFSMLWSKAHLNLDTTKLANMVNDWTPEEWNARRRLVHFQRSHQLFEGGILEIDCQISPMSQQQHHERRMQQNMAAAANAAAMAAAVAAGRAPTLQAPMPEAPPLVVSCIYWAERQDYYITSVDCIYLLEGLIGVQFTVEEKNRIRRNLEGFRPLTVSKSKEDSASFFRLIMSFPHPKPRNIEKDVKVFAWSSLGHALRKIVRKHTPSYSSTALPCSYAPY